MFYFAQNPKGEKGHWGQPIDLYKKTRKINEIKRENKDYAPVEYRNKNGKPIKFDRYKNICQKEILHTIKANPKLCEIIHENKTVADYAMDADVYDVFCTSLENSMLQKLIPTTGTNVFMRAILQDKPAYYEKLLNFPKLITDQDVHGRTALTLAIQNTLPGKFVKKIVAKDPRILTLMYQKQNPAMILLGVTKHINSGIVFKDTVRDQNFVRNNFDFLISSTIENKTALTQKNDKGQTIIDMLKQQGYNQFDQQIANIQNTTTLQNGQQIEAKENKTDSTQLEQTDTNILTNQ